MKFLILVISIMLITTSSSCFAVTIGGTMPLQQSMQTDSSNDGNVVSNTQPTIPQQQSADMQSQVEGIKHRLESRMGTGSDSMGGGMGAKMPDGVNMPGSGNE